MLALGPGEVSYVGAVAVQDMEVHTHNSGEERDVLAFGPGEMMYARAANSAPGTDSTDTAQDTVRVRGLKINDTERGNEVSRGDTGYDTNLHIHSDTPFQSRRAAETTVEAHSAQMDDATTSGPATYDAEHRHQHRGGSGEMLIPFTNITQLIMESNRVEPVGTHESLRRRQPGETSTLTGRDSQATAPHVVNSPRESRNLFSEQSIAYTTLGAIENAAQSIGKTRVVSESAQVGDAGSRAAAPASSSSEKIILSKNDVHPLREDPVVQSRVGAATSDAAAGQERRESRAVMRTGVPLLQGTAFADLPIATVVTRDDLRTSSRHHRDTSDAMVSDAAVVVDSLVHTGPMVFDAIHRHAKVASSAAPPLELAADDATILGARVVSNDDDGRHLKTESTATGIGAIGGDNHNGNMHLVLDTRGRNTKVAHPQAVLPLTSAMPQTNNAQLVSDTVRRHMKTARVDAPRRAMAVSDTTTTTTARAIVAPQTDMHDRTLHNERVSLGANHINGRHEVSQHREVVRQIIETPIGLRIDDATIGHEQQQIGVTTATDVRGIYESVQPQPGAMPQATFAPIGTGTHDDRKIPAAIPNRICNSEETSAQRLSSVGRHRTNPSELSPYGNRI